MVEKMGCVKNEMRYLQQAESSAIRFSYIEPKLPTGR